MYAVSWVFFIIIIIIRIIITAIEKGLILNQITYYCFRMKTQQFFSVALMHLKKGKQLLKSAYENNNIIHLKESRSVCHFYPYMVGF